MGSGHFLVPPIDGDGVFETKAPSRSMQGQTFKEYEQYKRMEALAALEERKAKEIKKPVKTHCMCGQNLEEYKQRQKLVVPDRHHKSKSVQVQGDSIQKQLAAVKSRQQALGFREEPVF